MENNLPYKRRKKDLDSQSLSDKIGIVQQDLGDKTQLPTLDKTSYVNALKEEVARRKELGINVKDYGATGSAQYATAWATAGSNLVTLSTLADFKVGDGISVTGAGTGGKAFVSKIVSINTSTKVLTLRDNAITTASVVVAQHDDSEAIQAAIDTISSAIGVTSGNGAVVRFPAGAYKIAKTINITKSNITLRGDGHYGSYIAWFNGVDTKMFNVDAGGGNKLVGFNMHDLYIDGRGMDVEGIHISNLMVGRFSNVQLINCYRHGVYMEEMYDSTFYGCIFKGNGKMSVDNNPATSYHAVYAYNGTRDNTNRIIFTACTWEANNGSHYYSDNTGNSRLNGQNQFISCKFHGKDPSNMANNPTTPAIYADGDYHYISKCMFFQTNEDFIQLKGQGNKVSDCSFYNCAKSFINVISGSLVNITGCSGIYKGSGYDDVAVGVGVTDKPFISFNSNLTTSSIKLDATQSATLLNSWVNYGSGFTNAQYYKDPMGIVRLEGMIKSGTTTTGTVLFTLPAGYAPAGHHYFTCQCDTGLATIQVYSGSGNVVIRSGTNGWISLSGINFRV